MLKSVIAAAVLVLSTTAADAQSQDWNTYDSGHDYLGSQSQDPWTAPDYLQPRQPESSIYSPPTNNSFGEPGYTYPKEPTLGDPRPYRRTDPRTCIGLLCD